MSQIAPHLPADHPHIASGRVGVLLVNLGTPDAPEKSAVRRYLAEFLSDRRVIEIPPVIWQVILRGIILNTRPAKSARAYANIWTDEGSPLAVITAHQAQLLEERLAPNRGQNSGNKLLVRHAMRYGNPAIGTMLAEMQAQGCERILLAPLYPQYCGATTASVVDKANEALGKMRWQPSLRVLPPYFDDPAYIDALASDISRQLAALDFTPEVLLVSFHGMPSRTLDLGDPYHCHCQKTARLLRERLGNDGLRIEVSFQSRFGRAKWLEPATDQVLRREGQAGTRSLAVVAPGFAADCVETLEELAIAGKEQFTKAGGVNFAALSCLNHTEHGMAMLEALVRRELMGWI